MMLFLAIAVAETVASPLATQPRPSSSHQITLDAGDALALAARLETNGRLAQAVTLYRQLVKDRDVTVRGEARYRLALVLHSQGRDREAAIELRKLLDEQPRAAKARIGLAQLLDTMGDTEGARHQLRAAQASDLPSELARMTERYANALRSRAPYGWSLEASLAPDNNINRATRSDTLSTVIGEFEINPGSKAKSGIGLALAGSAFLRIPIGGQLKWVSRVQGSTDRYRRNEFTRLSLSGATGAEWAIGNTRLAAEAGIERLIFSGTPSQQVLQASLRAYRPIGTRNALSASITGAKINNRLNDLQDGRSVGASVAIERALSASSGVHASLAANRFSARDPGYSTRSWEGRLGGWVELESLTVSAAASRGGLQADKRLSLFPDRRQDRTTRLTVGVHARQIQILGFSPLARLTFERNRSSVEIWDYSRRRLEVGIARAF